MAYLERVVFGDLHGCIKQLEELLYYLDFYKTRTGWQKSKQNPYFLISTGDLNDYRHTEGIEKASSIKCIQTMMELENKGWGLTVNSNHQDKLVRWFKGSVVRLSPGFCKTIEELSRLRDVEQVKIINWLDRLPYYYCFKEANKEYVVAHAYWSPNLETAELKDVKQKCLYGVDVKDWWHNSHIVCPKHIICGHWHTEYYAENVSIIDSSAGCGGNLTAFVPSRNYRHQVVYS